MAQRPSGSVMPAGPFPPHGGSVPGGVDPRRWQGLRVRLISGAVLAGPVLASIWAGFPWFNVMVAVAAVLLAREWLGMCAMRTLPALAPRLMVLFIGTLLVSLVLVSSGATLWAGVVLLAAAALTWRVTGGRWWPTVGLLYIGVPVTAMIWLRADPVAGLPTVVWLFAVVWASDIGAYGCGRLVGGPKLAPTISPNKTWAGLAGGILAAGIVGGLAAECLDANGVPTLALAAAVLGGGAQAGDLFESLVKRRFGVKDTGRLIPGHGGLMDRVDGLLAATVLLALISVIGKGSILTWQ